MRTIITGLQMSRLTARIMAIMLFPLAMFLFGLLSIDQYRTTLIQSEFAALERQGYTLARSLALAEADNDTSIVRRRLSSKTMTHLLPLVGLGSSLRARVFQPNGVILADTARIGLKRSVEIKRHYEKSWYWKVHSFLSQMIGNASGWFSEDVDFPTYIERNRQHASHYTEVIAALSGEPKRALRLDRDGQLMLSVAVPIQNLRLVRGALMMSVGGGKIEKELASVNIVFLELFIGALLVTLGLSLYLARSITTPISRLASAADQLRRSKDMSIRLEQLPHRKDEIGQLSDSLIKMTDELQKRIQATASFAADVAHEIKNPLSSLRSATETFGRARTAEQKEKLLNVILQDVSRLDRLITDISQASRVDYEIIGQDTESVDFKELLVNMVKIRSQTYRQQKLTLEVPEVPVFVKVNESRMVQVIDNLLSNASSFSPKGGVISLNLQVEKKFGRIVLEILDQGPGISNDKFEAIFDRFYTERPQGESFGEHSGLGLSIARQIVEAHRGTLIAENRSGWGASFKLTLPLSS